MASKRRDLVADGQQLFRDLVLAPLFMAGLASIANQKEMFYPPVDLGTAALVGATAAVGYHWIGRPMMERYTRPGRTVTMASLQRVYHPGADPDTQSWLMKWRDEAEREFVFTGLGIPSPVPETEFGRFIKTAWRRQVNAVYGSRLNMVWTNGKARRLTRNQIFSEDYFTRQVRPRFGTEDYYACLYVLALTRLIRGRRQGRGGELVYPYERTVGQARARWAKLLYPTEQKQTLFGIFPTRGSQPKFD